MNNVLEAKASQAISATVPFRVGMYAGSLAPAVLARVTQWVGEARELGAEVVAIATERDGESARRLADLHHVRCDYVGIGELAGYRGLDGVVMVLDEGGDMDPLEAALELGLDAFVATESSLDRLAVSVRARMAERLGRVMGLDNGHAAAVACSSRWVLGGRGIGEVRRLKGTWVGPRLEEGIRLLLAAAMPFLPAPVEKVRACRSEDSLRVSVFSGGRWRGVLSAFEEGDRTPERLLLVKGTEGQAEIPLCDEPERIHCEVDDERLEAFLAGASPAPSPSDARALSFSEWMGASIARRDGGDPELFYSSPEVGVGVWGVFGAIGQSLEQDGERVSAARL